jgi:hypothetical protein
VASPLAGVRRLFTYGQAPQDGGDALRFVGESDFGSRKLGPDGQTQYYNVQRARFMGLESSDAIVFLVPGDLDPLGFRVSTYDPETMAWDLVSAPGGPLAFLPPSGSAPGMFDFAGLYLNHDPMEMPAILDGTGNAGLLPFPSGPTLFFGSPLFDPTQPVEVDLSYLVGDTSVAFEDLIAAPLGDDAGLFGVPFGIPQYGGYVLTSAVFEQAGVEVPQTWDQLAELARALGTGRFTVDERAGPLHGPLTDRWFDPDAGLRPYPYDPVLARQLLEEAGWTADDGALP